LKKVVPKRFNGSPLPWWADHYCYEDFPTFGKILLDHASLSIISPERHHDAARITFAGLAQQNVRCVDTSFYLRLCACE
jgi:hypothetical protein